MRATFVLIATVGVTVVLLGTVHAQRGPLPSPMIKEGVTEKISDHVYVIPDNSVVLVPNIAIIVGSTATFVVDTGLGAKNGEIVMREVAKVSKNSELYLATTHIHPEHDLGAHAFPANASRVRATPSAAPAAQVKEIAADRLETAKRFAGFSPEVGQLLQGADFRKADITFDKEQVIDLGGVRVRMIAMGFNHTPGDTAFFVEPDAILVSGDVAMKALEPSRGSRRGSPAWTGSKSSCRKALSQATARWVTSRS